MRVSRVVGVGAVLAAGVAAGWYLVVLSAVKNDAPAAGPPLAGAKRLTKALPPRPDGLSLSVMPHLHPGMSRAEVEDVLGQPDPTFLQPVGEAGGRATYQTVYPLAIAGGGPRNLSAAGPQSFVTFEFDATLSGHPLINVRYSDPLF